MRGSGKYGIITAVIAGLLLFQAITFAEVTITAEPGTDGMNFQMVLQALDSFQRVASEQLQAPFINDAQLFICPTGASYAKVLETQMDFSKKKAERQVRITGGMSNCNQKVIAVYMNPETNIPLRSYFTTSHELMHQLQYQLTGSRFHKTPYWLQEGTADLIGITVAFQFKVTSFEQWQSSAISKLRTSQCYARPRELSHLTLNGWVRRLEAGEQPYAVADLMVIHLLETFPDKGYWRFADYFRKVGEGQSPKESFRECFGITLQAFEKDAALWLEQVAGNSSQKGL